MIRCREFIPLLGGAAAWPVASRAQQRASKLLTIGLLNSGTPTSERARVEAFVRRLRELGWIEGRTVAIKYRSAEGIPERFAEIAAEFVRLKVDLILAGGNEAALAAKQATAAIPIVFPVAGDPVGTGLVASLARPGEIEAAFATMVERRTKALLIEGDGFFAARYAQIIAQSALHSLPAISRGSEFPRAGGLMGYGASVAEADRQAAVYVGRILKGEKPADLPVQQAAKVEFIINLKTAKAIGLAVPPTLLALATEVIE